MMCNNLMLSENAPPHDTLKSFHHIPFSLVRDGSMFERPTLRVEAIMAISDFAQGPFRVSTSHLSAGLVSPLIFTILSAQMCPECAQDAWLSAVST